MNILLQKYFSSPWSWNTLIKSLQGSIFVRHDWRHILLPYLQRDIGQNRDYQNFGLSVSWDDRSSPPQALSNVRSRGSSYPFASIRVANKWRDDQATVQRLPSRAEIPSANQDNVALIRHFQCFDKLWNAL